MYIEKNLRSKFSKNYLNCRVYQRFLQQRLTLNHVYNLALKSDLLVRF